MTRAAPVYTLALPQIFFPIRKLPPSKTCDNIIMKSWGRKQPRSWRVLKPTPPPKSAACDYDLKEASSSSREQLQKSLETKKPWNLRRKKSTPDAPNSIGNSPAPPPPPTWALNQVKSPRPLKKKKEATLKFSIALSVEEIDADFLAIRDSKPPRRPQNKRPGNVQKAFNSIFPASEDWRCSHGFMPFI
ncbi:hypothetical protein ACLOJK_033020 [Asimina triloba]